jgi:HAAS domain-containing protein
VSNDAGKAHLDCYLDQVRRHLKGLPQAEADEVVAELRSHVLDKVAGAPTPERVEAAIAALGNPRDVARINLTERVAAELEADRSPLAVLRGVGRLARVSVYGAFTGLVSFVGYVTAAAFLITAVSKIFSRTNVGLWRVPDDAGYHYSMGVINDPGGQELLGWWIIPISLAAGLVLGWLTWRFGIFSVRRMRRSAQRGRA